ncbi:2-amino-4-hydroxy-6-hydroxymethyldihydropteridine diphosphokinase [Caenimonas koreensis]|uniref:2-amino-4-hydroxy-6-hydroxymethyldihydropteridine pyrophosphokinase n=1 Tax=Caenimonas koreensis DSM 17982 TaxID=1121255 RepID=A0A844AUM6_9BURK|nr:2-amino-4-hydroxy-6-hydroxymethyldihydropteridine diphosphokinase [Caenimonas koreensis]MRD47804.1 2-amino-4-hydroxy-6-hydroxymethyldihydropteridine diphosphokinase [Caenimonas koreensis DSM 17982]
MRAEVIAYVALGANLGDAAQAVRDAMNAIDAIASTRVVKRSSLYRTAPVESSGPDYINAVVEVRTQLSAPELLVQLQHIEAEAGRQRPYRNAPRTLDLDLLRFGDATMWSERLQLPHPRMNDRAFVLVPLAELAPHLVSPQQLQRVAGQPIARLPPTSLPA